VQCSPIDGLKKKLVMLFRKPVPAKNYIAVMSIENELRHAKNIINSLLPIAKDPNIKGLILHIDCLGGTIGTAQALFYELKKLKKIKPIVVFIEDDCTSGAYYIASVADFIFALPSSHLGSIGVYTIITKYKNNIKFDHKTESGEKDVLMFSGGDYKLFGSPYIPLKEEESRYFQDRILKQYTQFVADVAQARNLSIDNEKVWANGKTFVGTEALELGLIDGLGSFSDAWEKMKELLQERGVTLAGEPEILEIQGN
jgi:protease-4